MNKTEMKKKASSLRGVEGLYILTQNKEAVYIGKSRNIYLRILEHLIEDTKQFDGIKVVENEVYLNIEIIEVLVIKELLPKYNKLVIESEFVFLNTLPSFVFKDKSKEDFIKDKYTIVDIIKGKKSLLVEDTSELDF